MRTLGDSVSYLWIVMLIAIRIFFIVVELCYELGCVMIYYWHSLYFW